MSTPEERSRQILDELPIRYGSTLVSDWQQPRQDLIRRRGPKGERRQRRADRPVLAAAHQEEDDIDTRTRAHKGEHKRLINSGSRPSSASPSPST